MISKLGIIIAGFTSPVHIGTDAKSMLWMLPLLAAIAIIYKATKMRVIFFRKFVREVVILFFTIAVFMAATGLVLHVIVQLFAS